LYNGCLILEWAANTSQFVCKYCLAGSSCKLFCYET